MRDDASYRPAPIFDNGKSLLCGNDSVREQLPISENVKRVVARPFGGTHEKIFQYFGKGFDLDVHKAIQWLQQQEKTFQREVLLYQLGRIG